MMHQIRRDMQFVALRLVFFSIVIVARPDAAVPCSTFLLRTPTALIVGHNTDLRFHVPGCVVVNKRGVLKRTVSFEEIRTGRRPANPPLVWTSKYGSVTYNAISRDFPDGGLNEAGLYIGEMTLERTRFPKDDSKPKLFMIAWMQYVLDTCRSVEQVIETTDRVVLDGWGYHFFVADRSGDAAVIEFIDGKIRIYRGATLPVPVLCNGPYSRELRQLKSYSGFGGTRQLEDHPERAPRFACAAGMLRQFHATRSQDDPVDFGFKVLAALDRGSTRWSIACDLRKMRISFRTDRAENIRYLDFRDLDFSPTAKVRMLDIHADLQGNVQPALQDYAPELNRRFAQTAIHNILEHERRATNLFLVPGRQVQDVIEILATWPTRAKNGD